MSLNQDTTPGFPSNLGGTVKKVDIATPVDNVFTYSSAGEVWQRIFDGGNSVYRASWLFITGAPTNKASLLALVIANSAIKKIQIDTSIDIGTTNVNFNGKDIEFTAGGYLTSTSTAGTITNATIDADENLNIFNTTVTFTNCRTVSGGWSVKWAGANGDGVTDNTAIIGRIKTIALANSGSVIFPKGTFYVGALSATAMYAEFRPGAMIDVDNTLGYLTAVTGITAMPNQQIISSRTRILQVYVDDMFSVKWTGAKGDGVTNDSTAISTLNNNTNVQCRCFYFPRSSGKYIINTSFTVQPAQSATQKRRMWKFETGAILGGTATINASNLVIQADKTAQIFDTTLSFTNINVDDSMFSARWYIDEASYTNCTVAIQKAVTTIAQRCTLYVPTGNYPVDNLQIDCPVQGAGRGAAFTYPSDGSSGVILSMLRHDGAGGDVGLIPISDFMIIGNDAVIGLDFSAASPLAGRYQFNRLIINNCIRSVQKLAGSFGNEFNGCAFGTAEFCYYAVNGGGVHAGLDVFNNCRFAITTKAGIYISDDEGGGTSFNNCVLEYNYGFDVYIARAGANLQNTPMTFRSCWLEDYGQKNFPVTIDGITYTEEYNYFFNQAKGVTLDNCTLGAMLVQDESYIKIRGGAAISKKLYTNFDSTSIVEIVEPTEGFNSTSLSILSSGMGYNPRQTSIVKMPFPTTTVNSYASNLQISKQLIDESEFTASANYTKTTVDDGALFTKCIEVSNVTGVVNITSMNYTPESGKWYVIGIGFKYVDGDRVAISQTNAQNILSINANPTYIAVTSLITTKNQWNYLYYLRKTSGTQPTGFQIAATTDSSAIFRLSAYQVLKFDLYVDAIAFINQKIFVTPNAANLNSNLIGAITSDSSVIIPLGQVASKIVVASTTTQSSLLIGTTPGGAEIDTISFTGSATAGAVTNVAIYGTGANLIYFTNIAGTVNYRIILE